MLVGELGVGVGAFVYYLQKRIDQWVGNRGRLVCHSDCKTPRTNGYCCYYYFHHSRASNGTGPRLDKCMVLFLHLRTFSIMLACNITTETPSMCHYTNFFLLMPNVYFNTKHTSSQSHAARPKLRPSSMYPRDRQKKR